MKTFKTAVIGCGSIFSTHADAIINSCNAELYAVCDIDKERVDAAARKYDCRGFEDYEDLLSDRSIDVVHICTPHYLHAPMAIKALKSGKDVLVEKPVAISVRDAEEMIEASRQTGKKLGVCFQNRYNTTSKRIKEVLDSGKAGRILGGKAIITWNRDAEYYKSGEWRGTWDKEGGGVLINQVIHSIDLLQWFMGDIDKLKASVDTRLLEGVIEVEDTAEATIRFRNGAAALFYATNNYCVDSPVEIELVCENALISLKDDLIIKYASGKTEKLLKDETATAKKAYWGCSHQLLIHDFYNKLQNNSAFELDGAQAIIALKIVDAFYRSNKCNESVTI